MAADSYTIAIATGLTQDIAPVTLNSFPPDSDGAQPPEIIGAAAASAWTPAQVPQLTGPKRDRLLWTIDAAASQADALRLASFYGWQQNRIQNKLDARLSFTDEYFYTLPAPALTRAVVSQLATSDGQLYGYPVVDALISPVIIEDLGRGVTSGIRWQRVAFQIEEARPIA